MTTTAPAYTQEGVCRFCQAQTVFGGQPHAPDCPYAAALKDAAANGPLTALEVACCLVAEMSREIDFCHQYADACYIPKEENGVPLSVSWRVSGIHMAYFSWMLQFKALDRELQAAYVAQRHKAAVRLKELHRHAEWLRGEENLSGAASVATQVISYELALRDTGVLGAEESEADLLKEWNP